MNVENGVGIKVGCKVRHVTDIWNGSDNYGVGTVVAPDSWGGWIVDFPRRAYAPDYNNLYMDTWLVKVN